MTDAIRSLAVVTGASSGIGYELAKCCAEDGHDLIIAADDASLVEAAHALRQHGGQVEYVMSDLSIREGVDKLVDAVAGRQVDALLANAGQGLGHAFLDQDFARIEKVVDTNITGTLYLLHRLVPTMVERGRGRVLLTGSIAGFIPGTYQAVYNGTKAFIDSFSFALRHEIKDSGVTVTCLMPGATDTDFFRRADMEDTMVGEMKKDDPADVARTGYSAMLKGTGDVVHGLMNKAQVAMAAVTPQGVLAELHRKQAQPNDDKG